MQCLSLLLYLLHCLTRLAYAQMYSPEEILTQTPSCTHDCIINAFASFSGDLAGLASYVCTNISLQSELSTCVQTSCSFADQVSAAKVETELCAAFLKASRSWDVTRTIIIGCSLVFPTIALRLYTRVAYTKKLWTDDYATILAAGLLAVVAIIDLYSAHLGLGMHYWTIPADHGTLILKLFYVESMIYMLLLIASKLSILLVYARLFPARKFQYAVNSLSVFLACHGVLYLLLTAMQCLPVYSVWDRYITDRKCINVTAVAYSSGVISIIEDVAILLLPVPQVWRLKIDHGRRLAVLGLFSIGSFACFTSMIRMKYVVQYSATFDATWDNVDIVIWSAIEQFSAMFCGSLPPLRLLLVNVHRRTSRHINSRDDNIPSRIRQSNDPIPSQAPGGVEPADLHADGACSTDHSGFGEDRIRVTTTVEVRREEGTWFEDGSQHDDQDIEQRTGLPQRPLPVSLT
ncbi:hypothetical protein QBC46DRAFT_274670 [Diplogelasinospora grovesii]|uniref:CFEM domain-containing protein n=1 Tax=Diplogelasinospora grovesii TaxID=303347 RepID=A0AAN6MV41_9PEZI|nr:hypothetical protein QBC46DRAFT_274670 [Diplogelasinospora grovesii]